MNYNLYRELKNKKHVTNDYLESVLNKLSDYEDEILTIELIINKTTNQNMIKTVLKKAINQNIINTANLRLIKLQYPILNWGKWLRTSSSYYQEITNEHPTEYGEFIGVTKVGTIKIKSKYTGKIIYFKRFI